jgi:hypothetical protein
VDKVINILESVKLFLNTNRCIFFLGCDVNYLNSAVANYYEKFIKVNDEILKNSKIQYNIMDDMDSINRFTKEYLEKIIQVPFHIPSIDKNAMELYIESILNGRIEKTNEMSEFSKLLKKKGSQFKKEIPKKLVKELFAKRIINPRRIKRVLNIIYLNYLFLMTKTNVVTSNDFNLLILLAIINDEDHNFYESKLSSKEVCIDTFCENFMLIRETDAIDESNENDEKKSRIESLMNVFFNYTSINSKEDIISYLNNISSILTVSNTTHIITEYSNKWGKLGEIESVSKTKRKIKTFLNNIDNELALEFCIWFLKNIFLEEYDRGKLKVGIYNNYNLLIFRSESSKSDNFDDKYFNNNFLLKFNYDSVNKEIKVILNTGKYISKLKQNIINEKELAVKYENIEDIKQKLTKIFKGEEQ